MSHKTNLQTNNSALSANNVDLQSLIDQANALPAAIELPELTNPASEAEIFSGYETIDAEGNVKTGTFTLDTELATQDDLIAQISAALEGKAGGTGGVGTVSITINNINGPSAVSYINADGSQEFLEAGKSATVDALGGTLCCNLNHVLSAEGFMQIGLDTMIAIKEGASVILMLMAEET